MKIITQRQLIQAVAKRWRQEHEPFNDRDPMDKRGIADKLYVLDGNTATAEEVNSIIGNDSWTTLTCDECKKDTTIIVQVGEDSDYDAISARLCPECVEKAAAMIRDAQK